MAPSTPPPPRIRVLAALTIASTRCAVMSPWTSLTRTRRCLRRLRVIVQAKGGESERVRASSRCGGVCRVERVDRGPTAASGGDDQRPYVPARPTGQRRRGRYERLRG